MSHLSMAVRITRARKAVQARAEEYRKSQLLAWRDLARKLPGNTSVEPTLPNGSHSQTERVFPGMVSTA